MTHTHTYTLTKLNVQRSVGSKDRVETNGQTDRQTGPIALPFPANAVGFYIEEFVHWHLFDSHCSMAVFASFCTVPCFCKVVVSTSYY